jgi:hypothetical protein
VGGPRAGQKKWKEKSKIDVITTADDEIVINDGTFFGYSAEKIKDEARPTLILGQHRPEKGV